MSSEMRTDIELITKIRRFHRLEQVAKTRKLSSEEMLVWYWLKEELKDVDQIEVLLKAIDKPANGRELYILTHAGHLPPGVEDSMERAQEILEMTKRSNEPTILQVRVMTEWQEDSSIKNWQTFKNDYVEQCGLKAWVNNYPEIEKKLEEAGKKK